MCLGTPLLEHECRGNSPAIQRAWVLPWCCVVTVIDAGACMRVLIKPPLQGLAILEPRDSHIRCLQPSDIPKLHAEIDRNIIASIRSPGAPTVGTHETLEAEDAWPNDASARPLSRSTRAGEDADHQLGAAQPPSAAVRGGGGYGMGSQAGASGSASRYQL